MNDDSSMSSVRKDMEKAVFIPMDKREGSAVMRKIVVDSDGKVKKLRRKVKKKKRLPSSEVSQFIKNLSLVLLVAQMMGLVLLMRYSRTHGEKYIASTAVFLMEAMKFVICNIVVFIGSGSTVQGLRSVWRKNIQEQPMEVLKLCVPSFLYTVQNNLLYVALSNLDATTYQVTYQLKILTTALFSVILLQRKFSPLKWFSLVLLTIGVAIVQTSGSSEREKENDESSDNWFLGFICVVCAACTSGFAGVYFEKILKGSQTTLWVRNIQMGLPSVFIAYITVLFQDGALVRERGFFSGYSIIVWTVITVQAAGGLIVAIVVKYADNVLKVFATSFSIIGSCIISILFFGFSPNFSFFFGTFLVLCSTIIYSAPDNRRHRLISKNQILPK